MLLISLLQQLQFLLVNPAQQFEHLRVTAILLHRADKLLLLSLIHLFRQFYIGEIGHRCLPVYALLFKLFANESLWVLAGFTGGVNFFKKKAAEWQLFLWLLALTD